MMRSETEQKPPVTLRKMDSSESDLALFRECFTKNSDRPRSVEALRWQYFESVTGELFVDFAVDDAGRRLAAIYATLPGFMIVNGERRRMLQSLDTLTDADFRGQGLFVKLAKQTFARAADDGLALVYGFPNGNSAHGFFKKLEWKTLDPVPFLIRPLRTGYFAERLPGRAKKLAPFVPSMSIPVVPIPKPRGLRLVDVDRWDERTTDLWRDHSRGIGAAIDRDARYFDWRIGKKPGESYRSIALADGDRFEALCVFTTKEKHGGRVGYVMELLHRPGATRAAASLLSTALRAMAKDGADVALAWCFAHSPNHHAHVVNGFVPLPEKYRPIELHVGVRAFDGRLSSTLEDRTSWYLSYLDSDTV